MWLPHSSWLGGLEGVFTLHGVGSGIQLRREKFELIEHLLPTQRGNVAIDSLTVLNTIFYVAVNGCTWRGLPIVIHPSRLPIRCRRYDVSRLGVAMMD